MGGAAWSMGHAVGQLHLPASKILDLPLNIVGACGQSTAGACGGGVGKAFGHPTQPRSGAFAASADGTQRSA